MIRDILRGTKKEEQEFSDRSGPGSKECFSVIFETISIYVGKKLARILIFNEMKKQQINDLNLQNQYVQKIFINKILKESLSQVLQKEEIRNIKLVIFSKLFGTDKATEYVFQDYYISSKIPIEFICETFGDLLGESIIHFSENKHGVKDIRKCSEDVQIEFMNEILVHMFKGFQDELFESISISMIKFIKTGKISEKDSLKNILERFQISGERFISQFMKNLELYSGIKEFKNISVNEWADFVSKASKNESEKLKLLIGIINDQKHEGEGSKGASEEDLRNQNMISDIKVILSSHMSLHDAESLINMTLYEVQAEKVTEIISTSSDFIDKLINNSIIKEFSPNKISIIKDKLRNVFR